MGSPNRLSRRRVIQLAGFAAASAVATTMLGGQLAEAHGTIVRHDEINGVRTFYEGGGPSAFGYNPGFYTRLEKCFRFWKDNTPVEWGGPTQIWTLGAHADHRPSEAHNSGRGFDLTRIRVNVNGSLLEVFNARYSTWNSDALTGRNNVRRWYWATAACMHYHFRNVLTYAYNDAHHDHAHIDNLASGGSDSRFNRTSEAQVKHVQACCSYVWGIPTTIDGAWGPQTDGNSKKVLIRIGRAGTLTSSQRNWMDFNQSSVRHGTGRQRY